MSNDRTEDLTKRDAMSKMGDLHAETASDRADVEFLKNIMRIAAHNAGEIAEILHATANPNSVIATDLIERLNRIIDGLRQGAGAPSLRTYDQAVDLEDVEF